MIVPIGGLEDAGSTFECILSGSTLAEAVKHATEFPQGARELHMFGPINLLLDARCPFEHLLGVGQFAEVCQDRADIGKRAGALWMIGAVGSLEDAQCAGEHVSGTDRVALFVQDDGDVAEGTGDLGMVRTMRGLEDAERTLECRPRGAEVFELDLDRAEAPEDKGQLGIVGSVAAFGKAAGSREQFEGIAELTCLAAVAAKMDPDTLQKLAGCVRCHGCAVDADGSCVREYARDPPAMSGILWRVGDRCQDEACRPPGPDHSLYLVELVPHYSLDQSIDPYAVLIQADEAITLKRLGRTVALAYVEQGCSQS